MHSLKPQLLADYVVDLLTGEHAARAPFLLPQFSFSSLSPCLPTHLPLPYEASVPSVPSHLRFALQ